MRFHGSGWVYNKNTIVTAGHCVYSKETYGLVAARDIDIYIGYSGVYPHPTGEHRRASRVFVHRKWYDRHPSCSHDVAVIRLETPFNSPGVFTVAKEGETDLMSLPEPRKLFIVGYPSEAPDYSHQHQFQDIEGCVMYESAAHFDFKSFRGYLTYKADTFGGNQYCTRFCHPSLKQYADRS